MTRFYHFKLPTVALVALASLTVSSTVYAQPASPDTLVLTELSDNTLTYSLNGSAPTSVSSVSVDDWLFTIPLVVTSPDAPAGFGTYIADWQEPGEPGLYNYVGYNAPGGTGGDVTIDVFSDYGYAPGGVYPNRATYDFTVAESVGSLALNVTFNDDGDSTGVPDGGNAAVLLALTATALGLIKRARVA